MQVDILVDEPARFLAMLSLLRGPAGQNPALSVRTLRQWAEFEERSLQGAFDLAIVQPDYHRASQDFERSTVRPERLRSPGYGGAVAVFLSRTALRERPFRDPHRPPWDFYIKEGASDDPPSLLRLVARAKNLEAIRQLIVHRPDSPKMVASEPVLTALIGWPPPRSVQNLAGRLHLSARTLRRRFFVHGVPSPQRLLRWGVLLEGATMVDLGVTHRGRLATLLGRSDCAALAHLCRALTGTAAQDLLRPQRAVDLLERFLQEFRST